MPQSVGIRTDIELARLAIATATRAEVRLEYRLLADRRINELLAERLRAFDRALQDGYFPSVALRLVIE